MRKRELGENMVFLLFEESKKGSYEEGFSMQLVAAYPAFTLNASRTTSKTIRCLAERGAFVKQTPRPVVS
jgi:hypothetical protein